jgi:hypothetical protein
MIKIAEITQMSRVTQIFATRMATKNPPNLSLSSFKHSDSFSLPSPLIGCKILSFCLHPQLMLSLSLSALDFPQARASLSFVLAPFSIAPPSHYRSRRLNCSLSLSLSFSHVPSHPSPHWGLTLPLGLGSAPPFFLYFLYDPLGHLPHPLSACTRLLPRKCSTFPSLKESARLPSFSGLLSWSWVDI